MKLLQTKQLRASSFYKHYVRQDKASSGGDFPTEPYEGPMIRGVYAPVAGSFGIPARMIQAVYGAAPSGLAINSVLNPKVESTFTSRGNPYQYRSDHVIRGFENDKFSQRGNNGGRWWWIPAEAAAKYLYRQRPMPDSIINNTSNSYSNPIIVPHELKNPEIASS